MFNSYQGRGAELIQAESVIRHWLQVESGSRSAPRLMLICGVAGIGKSCFKDELLRRLRQGTDALIVSYRCCPTHQWCRFLTACIDCLSQLGTGVRAVDWEELCSRASDRLSAQRAAQLALLAHDYEHHKDSHQAEPVERAAEPEPEDFDFIHQPALAKLEELATAALELASAVSNSPLLLCLDDLHWLGRQEEEMRCFIGGLNLSQAPVLIGLVRSEDACPQLAPVLAGQEKVVLRKIDSNSARQIIKDILAGRAEEPVAQDIEDLAAGLPLLLQQAAQLEQEQPGSLKEKGAGPSRLEEILLRRVDGLGEDLRQLVWLLAVAGPDLLDQVVLRLHHRRMNAAGMKESARLFELPAEISGLNLRHDEIRRVVLGSIPPDMAIELELLVASELQRQLRHGRVAELDALRALCSHLRRAGERSERHRYICRLMMLQITREHLEDFAELEAEAQATADGDSPWLIRAQANYRVLAGESESSRALLELALEQCEGRDRAEIRGQIQGDLGIFFQVREQYNLAIDYYEQSIQSLSLAGNQRAIGIAQANIGTALHRMGRLEEARERYEISLSTSLSLGDSSSSASTYGFLGNLQLDLGKLVLAASNLENSLRLYTDLKNYSGMASAMSDLANLYRESGDYEKAEQTYRAALELRSKLRDDSQTALTCYNLGRLFKMCGRLDEARLQLERACALNSEDSPAVTAVFKSELGDVLCLAGQAALALPILQAAGEILAASTLAFFCGVCLCYTGCCCLDLDMTDEARAILGQAEKLFVELGSVQDLDFWPELQRLRQRINKRLG